MSIQQKDHILRLVEQAAAALRQLRERLATPHEIAHEIAHDVARDVARDVAHGARLAQRELLGQHAALLQALDATSAAAMVRDPERLALWVDLLRVESEAHRRAGDLPRADASLARAAALGATLGPRA